MIDPGKGKITKNGNLKVGSNTYYKKICHGCCKEYWGIKNSRFCSYKCSNNDKDKRKNHSKNMSGHKNPFFGKKHTKEMIEKIHHKSQKTIKSKMSQIWFERLKWCEKMIIENNILFTICNYCGKKFVPTSKELKDRHINVNIKGVDGSRLYCSDSCKEECPIYHKTSDQIMKEDAVRAGNLNWIELNREVQPELRQMVLKRDDYTCQKCGNTEHLHCHHIKPVADDPIESADIDNCITYCKECHKKAHQQDGCKYGQLRICI